VAFNRRSATRDGIARPWTEGYQEVVAPNSSLASCAVPRLRRIGNREIAHNRGQRERGRARFRQPCSPNADIASAQRSDTGIRQARILRPVPRRL